MTARRPRCFVHHGAIVTDRAVLLGAERHHLRVRRIGPGDSVELFDDLGRVFDGVVTRITANRVELKLSPCQKPVIESPLDLTLAVALMKAGKIDLVVEKATELGVTRIVLFSSERALGGSSPGRVRRWQRIAVSAAEQSGRSLVPAIEGPESLAALASRSATLRLVCWEQADVTEPFPQCDKASSLIMVVGPEGGLTGEEVAGLRQASFQPVSLGPRILRGETAAIAAVVLAQRWWGDLGGRVA